MFQFIFSFVWESLFLFLYDFLQTTKHIFEFEFVIFICCLLPTIFYYIFYYIKRDGSRWLLQLFNLFFIIVFFSCLECLPYSIVFLLSKWMTLTLFLEVWLPIFIIKIIIWKKLNDYDIKIFEKY